MDTVLPLVYKGCVTRPLATILVLLAVLACGRTETTRAPHVFQAFDGGIDAGRDSGPASARDAGIDGGTDGGPKPCITGDFRISPAEPVVMLVLDRSGSMRAALAPGIGKWDALRASLDATLPAVNQTMQLGGLFFPIDGFECEVPAVAGVRPARGNVPLLLSTLAQTEPLGGTPTQQALTVAANILRSRRTGSTARAIVLATDGEPTCSDSGDSPFNETVAALGSAQTDGIPTFVIGVQTASSPGLATQLTAFARAGGRPRVTPPLFYSAESPAELQQAFTTIRNQVAACSFLTDSVPNTDRGIRVAFAGQTVPYDETGVEGWRWTDRSNGELVLVGQACSTAIARPSALQVRVDCGRQ
jgi:hypothetical protein